MPRERDRGFNPEDYKRPQATLLQQQRFQKVDAPFLGTSTMKGHLQEIEQYSPKKSPPPRSSSPQRSSAATPPRPSFLERMGSPQSASAGHPSSPAKPVNTGLFSTPPAKTAMQADVGVGVAGPHHMKTPVPARIPDPEVRFEGQSTAKRTFAPPSPEEYTAKLTPERLPWQRQSPSLIAKTTTNRELLRPELDKAPRRYAASPQKMNGMGGEVGMSFQGEKSTAMDFVEHPVQVGSQTHNKKRTPPIPPPVITEVKTPVTTYKEELSPRFKGQSSTQAEFVPWKRVEQPPAPPPAQWQPTPARLDAVTSTAASFVPYDKTAYLHKETVAPEPYVPSTLRLEAKTTTADTFVPYKVDQPPPPPKQEWQPSPVRFKATTATQDAFTPKPLPERESYEPPKWEPQRLPRQDWTSQAQATFSPKPVPPPEKAPETKWYPQDIRFDGTTTTKASYK